MHAPLAVQPSRAAAAGWTYGLLGVLTFSLTLPASRVVSLEVDAVLVAAGRAVVAALIGALCLALGRAPRPRGSQWISVGIVSLCLGIGFPTLVGLGARDAQSAHGAVILGLLPLGTTLAGMARVGERPSPAFWLASLLGSGAVIVFALARLDGADTPRAADAVLLAAAFVASLGYAESARVAPALGPWQVVCWALLLVLPVNLATVAWRWSLHPPHDVSATAIGCFAYVAAMSQLFGVMLWTRGLHLGGVSRVGQLQLLMPFFTFVASAWWLRERVPAVTWMAAGVVLISILLSRRAPVARAIVR